MPWSPAVTVAAVIRQGDRFLMVEETAAGQRVINQPAGHLEDGESLFEAVVREVMEETARPFTAQALVGIYQWRLPDRSRTYLRFCFSGSVADPVPGQALDPDILATHWMTPAQIRGGGVPVRSPMVLRCIEDALAGRSLPLDCLHELDRAH
jgi:8-oxo-dGTP pyrophosphatase MutT (NUDIX family)